MTTLLLPLVLLLPSQEPAVQTPELVARVTTAGEAVLERLQAEGTVVGGAAAIVMGDGAPILLPFGQDVPGGRAITAEDRFCAGSVGKTFFAGLAFHHVAQGKLDLDAYVLDLLDDERIAALPNAEELTVRHLLRHQTGIPRYIEEPGFWRDLNADKDRVWEPGSQLSYVAGKDPLHAAGQGWAYSDTNYVVLGMVLEKLEGRSAYAAITERLIVPHGLDQTVPQTSRELEGLVQGHISTFKSMGFPDLVLDGEGRFCVHPSFEYGGGGWVSSPRDLARWARILWTGAAVEGAYLEAATETVAAPMLRARYGLGVIERDTRAGKLLGHDGIFIGYLTAMGYFPELDLAVAIQLNQDNGRAVGKPLFAVMVDLAMAVKSAREDR